MKKDLFKLSLGTIFFIMLSLISCSKSSDNGMASLSSPKIIQKEEILDNPITLAFSWEAVSNATEYRYQLETVKATGNEVIASGSTNALSIEIASTAKAELLYSTEYAFILRAVSSDSKVSEPTEVRVTTSGGAIALSVENLTYRSALLKGAPVDKNMLYQFAQVPVEKYKEYESDKAFIEGYDYGYYKAMSAQMPYVPWYGFMEEGSKKGNYEYNTRILKPRHDYILYAYGVEFDKTNTDNPVKVVTPMIKYFFTTPEWKATSTCTFTASVEGQEIVDTDNGPVVNIKVKVTPSDAKEKYYVAFVTKKMLAEKYDNDIYSYAFDAVYSEEIYSSVDWATTNILNSGEKVVASMDNAWGIYTSTDYRILVFGVDNNGLVTTDITSIDCTSIGEKSAVNAQIPMKRFANSSKQANNTTDRF